MIIIVTINYNVRVYIQYRRISIYRVSMIASTQELYRVATSITAAFCGFETQVAKRKYVHQIRLMNNDRAGI